jgi:hypothetical protein
MLPVGPIVLLKKSTTCEMHYPCSIIPNITRECYIVEADAAGAWGVMEEVTTVIQLVVCELGEVFL